MIVVTGPIKEYRMEPNLEDMDDYEKPLSKSKTKTIVFAFAIVLAIYVAYALIMNGL